MPLPILDAKSMGELMDTALGNLMVEAGRPALPPGPAELVDDRKRFFRAIASGVIEHLKAHPEAFVMKVTVTSGLSVDVTMKEIL